MQTRYIVAVLVAGLLFAGLLGYARLLRQSVLTEFRESLHEAKVNGELPEEMRDLEIETATPEDFNTEMSASAIRNYDTAEIIERFWYVWLILLIVMCCGVASLLPSDPE